MQNSSRRDERRVFVLAPTYIDVSNTWALIEGWKFKSEKSANEFPLKCMRSQLKGSEH